MWSEKDTARLLEEDEPQAQTDAVLLLALIGLAAGVKSTGQLPESSARVASRLLAGEAQDGGFNAGSEQAHEGLRELSQVRKHLLLILK